LHYHQPFIIDQIGFACQRVAEFTSALAIRQPRHFGLTLFGAEDNDPFFSSLKEGAGAVFLRLFKFEMPVFEMLGAMVDFRSNTSGGRSRKL